ncbi:MAG TPA: thioredoxin domain-containing protein [Ktedonobacteraceae bacterium]|jgi:thioredoxin 1|nr:thioredoxin domain-containing protein [Ktedonobacteraceae bacterium]
MAESYIEVTDENFGEKVLQAPQMVVVYFSSEQSGACQIQEPEFVAISKEYGERITFARLNVDTAGTITSEWNIDGIPTLIFFKGGNELYRIRGIVMRARLRRQIEGVLLAANS